MDELEKEQAPQGADTNTADTQPKQDIQTKPEEVTQPKPDKRLTDLEKREQAASLKELRLDTLDLLEKSQLDKDFLDWVIGKDLENTKKRIENFKPLFDKKVQEQVEKRLAGKTPPAGSAGGQTNSVRDQFKKALGGIN